MDREETIRVNRLRKVFDGRVALHEVDLGVNRSEIFGLIGPDGAGKSTLIRILATLMIPSSGSAEILGYDTVKDFRKIRKLVGYMPEKFSLYQDLTVEENLQFYAAVFGTTIRENYHLIEDIYVRLEPFRRRLAGRLSGGMKQKLALCCAMIHSPRTLFLDEPTTGVDAVSRKEFWEMLRRLRKRGLSILVSTPYMDEAGLCDRIALINKGRILAVERPDAIAERYGKRLFEVRTANMYRLMEDLRRYRDTRSVFLFGQVVHYTDKKEERIEGPLRKYLRERGHSGITVRPVKADVEDCFMELMREQENER